MVSEDWPELRALSLKQRNFGEKMREQAVAELAAELGDLCGEALANDDATFWIAIRATGWRRRGYCWGTPRSTPMPPASRRN